MLGMANGMATIKLTITLDHDQFEDVKEPVDAGQASERVGVCPQSGRNGAGTTRQAGKRSSTKRSRPPADR